MSLPETTSRKSDRCSLFAHRTRFHNVTMSACFHATATWHNQNVVEQHP